jgi:hypothetical protein
LSCVNERLNPGLKEELYFSVGGVPNPHNFETQLPVRVKPETLASASKHMERSKLKGLMIEKEDTVKKVTNAQKRQGRKEKVNASFCSLI